jgi:D-glycero-D-manno-heptose 1,7-bisphosphate phosphatase
MPTDEDTSNRPAIFFDRDGTLMEEEDHCDHPTRVRAIRGAREALADLHTQGWLTIIITNQSGIGRGYFTWPDFDAVNQELLQQLDHTIDGIYCCADHPDRPTPRRKPGIGMLEEAVRDHHIDLASSWLVGDKDIDIACGKNAGCRTILVQTGYGAKHRDCGADFIARDVVEAISIIQAETADLSQS